MPVVDLSGFVVGGLPAGVAAGVAMVGAAALTALYLLKRHRRQVVVAFAPLWTALGGERRSEKWARRLRRWVSLLLQLAFLGLLLLAAVDPRPATANDRGRSIVVLIDRSASMGARDEDGPRLDRARRAADAIVDGLGGGDRAMIVSFATDVSPESGFDDDPARLHAAIAPLTVSEEPGDLLAALRFARAVLRERPHPTLVLISDGAFSEDTRQQIRFDDAPITDDGLSLAGIDARFVAVGRRQNNIALLSLSARRKPADPTAVEAALVVQNFRPVTATAVVEIAAGARAVPIDRLRLTLAPGQRVRHLLSDVPAADTRLQATLLPDAGGATDDLALDDRAFAVVPAARRLKVLRVGRGDLFVDGALLSLGDAVDVRRVPAEAAETTRATWNDYDVVIFDGVTPATAPVTGRFLFLDPNGAGSPFATRGSLNEPIISDSRPHHPLLRHLSLADVNIAKARRLVLAPDDTVVASALGNPLIVARTRPGLRVVALAFDVRQSDLPMRTAFPLLLANSLSFLAGVEQTPTIAVATGQTAHIAIPAGAATLTLTDPTGKARPLIALGDSTDLPIASVGFYRIDGRTRDGHATAPVLFAANLNDAVESDTTPVSTLTLGGRWWPAPDSPRRRPQRPYWAWALMAAAALTLFEWASYHRRWTV
ncbi:MAG TPA: VWA domain-containing protein [Polyangia bacterium]